MKLDSLIYTLTLEKRDAETVNTYMLLANEYMEVMDYSIALTYANLAYDLSTEMNNKAVELDAALLNAHIYLAYYLDYKRALSYYDRAFILATEHGFEDRLIEIYRGYSSLYASVKEYDLATEFNKKAIIEAGDQANDQLLSDLHAYGGSIYEEQGDTIKALEKYKEVLTIEQANNFIGSSRVALTTVAHYYFLIGEIDQSLDLYRKALVRFERLMDYRWVAYTHAEMANVYLQEGRFGRAEKHALSGLSIARDYGLNKEEADNLRILTKIYRQGGDEKSAQKYQKQYQQLMDSLMVDIPAPKAASVLNETEVVETTTDNYLKPWVNLTLILLIVIVVVLFSGFVFKSNK
ncbi:MAG: tetratricopeptide repeat protein [Crocinitomicaceae bacterium]